MSRASLLNSQDEMESLELGCNRTSDSNTSIHGNLDVGNSALPRVASALQEAEDLRAHGALRITDSASWFSG
jgi:hypothetical protein